MSSDVPKSEGGIKREYSTFENEVYEAEKTKRIRKCLKCSEKFESVNNANRLCRLCRRRKEILYI